MKCAKCGRMQDHGHQRYRTATPARKAIKFLWWTVSPARAATTERVEVSCLFCGYTWTKAVEA